MLCSTLLVIVLSTLFEKLLNQDSLLDGRKNNYSSYNVTLDISTVIVGATILRILRFCCTSVPPPH